MAMAYIRYPSLSGNMGSFKDESCAIVGNTCSVDDYLVQCNIAIPLLANH